MNPIFTDDIILSIEESIRLEESLKKFCKPPYRSKQLKIRRKVIEVLYRLKLDRIKELCDHTYRNGSSALSCEVGIGEYNLCKICKRCYS